MEKQDYGYFPLKVDVTVESSDITCEGSNSFVLELEVDDREQVRCPCPPLSLPFLTMVNASTFVWRIPLACTPL
jgi:hypothetical protein